MDKELEIFMSTNGPNGEKVNFELDKQNNLYINGKRVLTREVVQLRGYELFLATVTMIAIVVQSVFTVLKYYSNN